MSYSQQRRSFTKALALTFSVATISGCNGLPYEPQTQTPLTWQAARTVTQPLVSWNFTTLTDPDNPNYDFLTGINNAQKIAGYIGNGSKKDPYTGFVVLGYGRGTFRSINYPSAVDTVVTSLSSSKSVAGYYSTKQGWIFGFIEHGGIYTSYKDTKLNKGDSNITELLGINDSSLAVGFYTDQYGVDHAFELNATTGQFHPITPPDGVSVEATGINGKGDIVGVMTTQKGSTSCAESGCEGWLLKGGSFTTYAYPQATNTEALAVNWQDQIVGLFVDRYGNTHGFVLSNLLTSPQWQQVDEPKADGKTVVSCIQDDDYIVGYYQDSSSGYINGFLGTPQK